MFLKRIISIWEVDLITDHQTTRAILAAESQTYLKVNRESCTAKWKYNKTLLLRPPLGLKKKGLSSGVVLLLSEDKEEINEMGL